MKRKIYVIALLFCTLAAGFTPASADIEPDNNVYTGAEAIELDAAVSGNIGDVGDTEDWYQIITTEDGDIQLSLEVNGTDGQYAFFYLYDSNGTTYLSPTSGSPFDYGTSGVAVTTMNGLAAGTYYVNVDNGSGAVGYTLTATVLPDGLANDTEPNDLPAEALSLELNESVTGHIGYRKNGGAADAEDWYQFTTTEDGDIQLSLEVNGSDGQFAYFYLYDSNGTTYLSPASGNPYDYGTPGAAVTTMNGLAAGTYYVNVDNGFGAVGYTLIASVIPPAETNDPEVNDAVATATPILTNVTTEGHINYRYNGGSGDDNDYFQLTTHSSGTLSLSFDFSGTDGQYAYFYLYQSNGTTVISGSGLNYDYGAEGAVISDFGNLAAGTYYIRINDGSGAAGYKITNNFCPDAITIEAEGETVVCEGDYVTLSTPDNHWSYLWSTGATTSTINAILSDDYSLTIDNGNGCVRTSNTITVEVEPAPSADVIADGPTTFCEGESVMLSVDFEADAYLWSNGETTPSITVSEGGEYYVVLTKGNCVGESQPILITVNPIPSATITAQGPTTFCDGGSVMLKAPAGNDSYLWSTGATGSSIVADATGEYSCVVTDNGCSATSNVITVTENPYPVVMIEADGPTEFCSGESVMLSASGADSYFWNTGATTSSITVGSSGDYTVTGTTNGCSSMSNTITVTVTPCGDVTIEADGPTEFCDGGSVMLTSSEASGNVWSTGETTQSIVVTGSGDYSVTVNGNTSNIISVTVNPNPVPEISATGATEFCEGGSVELISEGSYASYQWSTGETSSSIAVSESGNYSVTVTDANGCSGTSNVIHVAVQANPSVEVTAGGPTEFCLGKRVKLMAASNGDVQWYYNGEAVEPPYGQSPVLNAGRTGSYWAMASIGSCTTTSNSIEVTVNGSKVSVQPKGPVNICEADGETAILKANVADSGATIRWRRDGSLIAGAFGQYYTVSKAGTYEAVAIYDGCNTLSNSVLVKNACRAGAAMEAAISNWSVYPNPTESGSVMEFQSAISGSAMLRIMDAGGRVLHTERFEVFTGSNMKLINLGAMSAGLYQIQLIGPDGSAVQQSIVRVE